MPVVAVLGALPDIIIALVALGIIFGLFYIGIVMTGWGNKIPVVGVYITRAAQSAMNWAVAHYDSVLDAATQPIRSLLQNVTDYIHYYASEGAEMADVTYWAIHHTITVIIPRYYNKALTFTRSEVKTLEGYIKADVQSLTSQITAARTYAHTLYSDAEQYARNEVSALTSIVKTDVNNLTQAITNAEGAAKAFASGIVANAVRAVETEIGELRSWASAQIAATAHDLAVDIDNAETAAKAWATDQAENAVHTATEIIDTTTAAGLISAWPQLVTDVQGLISAIPAELTDIRDLVGAIPDAIPASLTDVTVIEGAIDNVMIRYLKDCGIPLCNNLHGLSDLFGDLLDAASIAALLAFIAEMVNDPARAADDVESVCMPIVNAGRTLVDDLVGVS